MAVYQEISYRDPLSLALGFVHEDGIVLLDSAQLREGCGRYSFLAFAPTVTLSSKNGVIHFKKQIFSGDPFAVLAAELQQHPQTLLPNLPPFQGGAAGYFSYDLCHHLEKLPTPKPDDMNFPDMMIGFYDVVIAFDHVLQRAWIFSTGYPEQDTVKREQRANLRLQECLQKMIAATIGDRPVTNLQAASIQTNFTPEEYQQAVKKVLDYILAGDIFEANISQRFSATLPRDLSPFDLYCRLRNINPAPFAAYLQFGDIALASASPERFIQLSAGQVEARPIKGTRPRGKNAAEDKLLAEELLASEKDHAENVMIVDLLRNDLSRVCEDHSVQVAKLCGLESYATVHHLVSVISGKLSANYHAVDLLRATFPGGSITGAPKIRAMEIIAEIEPTLRGPYCGSIGYIGFNGEMDCSITIRTYAIKNNRVTFQAGGAIVADSDPLAEYEETLTKSRALHRALQHDFAN